MSTRRYELIPPSKTNLMSPAPAAARPRPAQKTNLTPLKLYAYKEGKTGRVTLAIISDFIEDP